MKRENLTPCLVFVALVALAVAVRLVSETPNFNAVTAAALFAGFYYRSRLTALCVPLVTMAISNAFLGGYSPLVMVAVYGALFVPVLWRPLLRRKLSPVSVGAGAVSSTLTFYLLSNAAVWYVWYPHTWAGLTKCYYLALFFLPNALASDLLFSAGFFGLYVLCVRPSAERVARLAHA